MTPSIPWDTVKVEYSLEDTINSASVRVFVRATMLMDPAGAERANETLREALRAVIDERWSISQVDRQEDPTGLEHVVTVATVRVDQELTAGLIARMREASRSGLKLELMRFMQRPPAVEVAAAMKELRRQAYDRANEEADLLNSVLTDPNRIWSVGKMVIEEHLKASDDPMQESAAYLTRPRDVRREDFGDDDGSMTSNVVTLKATVILQRPSVEPPAGGFFAANE